MPMFPFVLLKWRFAIAIGVVWVAVLSGREIRADTIYRETFGRPNGSAGNINPSIFSWALFTNGIARTDAYGISPNTGSPLSANVTNVNAGANADGSVTSYAIGLSYQDTGSAANNLIFTPEYSFDPGNYVAGSIVFSWYQGNAATANTYQIAVQTGGNWYVSAQTFANTVTVSSGGNFGTLPAGSGGAQPMAFTYSATAANWRLLNFNGSYTTNNGGTFVNSTVALTTGAAPASNLSGPITAFGFYGQQNGAVATMRFDTLAIDATPAAPAGKNVTWTGNLNANWNTNTFNWIAGGVATNYADGDTVLFNDAASLSTVNIPTTVSPASVTVSNNALAYVFAGSGGIGGSGGLTKLGTNGLTFGGTNLYSGAMAISNGTVLVNGRNNGAGPVTVSPGATLGGMGVIAGAVLIQPGGTLAPGASNGVAATLTMSNSLTLLAGSFTTMRVQTGSIKDQAASMGAVTYGGTLTVTNVGGPLVAGDIFQLFAAAGYAGNFSAIYLPPPGANLTWLNNLTVNGTLTVATPVAAAVTNLPATSVQGTYATLNGQVLSTGSQAPLITLYYGLTDGGTNPIAWGNSVVLGTQSGSFSYAASGLATNTTYYHTISATNGAGVVWAAPARSFTTLNADPANVPTLVQYLSGTDKDHTVPWQFSISTGRKAGIASTIQVPSCWELQGFGNYQYGGSANGETGFYTNTFAVPSNWAGKKIFLVFEGVFTDTSASINGLPAGATHQGAFYEFKYDVTPSIVPGASTNVLQVTVQKWSASINIQHAEQQGVDYWDFGGIFRPVYLEAKPPAYIDRIAANPLANGQITVNTYVGGITGGNYSLSATVTDSNGVPVGSAFTVPLSAGQTNATLSAALGAVNPWSSEFPTLYTLTVQLLNNSTPVHAVTSPIGFRTVSFVNNQGFFINGKKIVMRGVDRHEEWPTTGRTTSRALSDLDITMIKEANFNAIRCSHYPPNKVFLEECDRLGIYVLDELDSYQHGGDQGGNGPMDVPNGVRLIGEMIARDVNHPCIFAWDNGNESGANPNLDGGAAGSTNYFALNDIQKRLVIRPQQGGQYFDGVATDHYEVYSSVTNYLRAGAPGVFMPTEMLHCLYDGGGGACLAEIWEAFRTSPQNSGGMFLWSWDDAGIVHDDTGVMDVSGASGPDGIVGPYREKEASYYSCKSIFSTVQIGLTNLATFNGTLTVSNRFDFTDLAQCAFNWQLGWYADATDATNYFSTNALTGGLIVGATGGSFSGPSLPPGGTGSLVLPSFPGTTWTNYDALRVTATDPFGNNIYTWTLPLRTQAQIRDRLLGPVSMSAPGISAGTNATDIIVTNGARIFRFSKTTGVITSLTISNQPVSFNNGPRPVAGSAWAIASITNYFDGINYIILVNDLTNAANGFQWTLRPDGWLKLSYRYTLTGPQENIGITFDYPGNQLTAMSWLGQGPFRVWENRSAGQEIFSHTKGFNFTWTGQSTNYGASYGKPTTQWVYPEFEGYHGQLFWATLQTTEQPITVSTPTANMFFRVATPPVTDVSTVNATFPPGTISLLQGISAMGSKFVVASTQGPTAATNIALGLYTAEANFFFGPLPAANTDRDNNSLNDAWELKNFGTLGQNAFSRASVDGYPLMLENAFDLSPASNNASSPRLPHLAKGISAPVGLGYSVPASQSGFFNYIPQLSDDLFHWTGMDERPEYFGIGTNTSGSETIFTVQPFTATWPGDTSHLFLRLKIKPKP